MKAIVFPNSSAGKLTDCAGVCRIPMLRLFDRPLFEYMLDSLKRCAVDEVRIILPDSDAQSEKYYCGRSGDGIGISVIRYGGNSNAVSALIQAATALTEPFFVLDEACFFDFDLGEIMDFHLSRNADVTVVCSGTKNPKKCDTSDFSECVKVKSFTEKTAFLSSFSDGAGRGVYVFNPDVLSGFEKNDAFSSVGDLFPLILKKGKSIMSFRADGYMRDISCAEDYLRCHFDIMDLKTKYRLPELAGGIYSPASPARGDYVIAEPCYIAKNVSIGAGAVIGPYAVIGEGCSVGKNSVIRHSLLMRAAVTEENVTLDGVTVGEGARIKSGAAVGAGSVVGRSACPEGIFDFSGNSVMKRHRLRFNDDNRFSGRLGTDIDCVSAALIGRALAESEIGRKTGILTDGSAAAKAISYCLIGSLITSGSRVWNFGEGFYAQLEFYTRFCGLKSGIFVNSSDTKINITICGENGLGLCGKYFTELENRLSDMPPTPYRSDTMKDVSDMSGVEAMYRREIIRQTDTELSDVSCCIKCPNEKISLLLDDCLYRLGCRTGNGLTFKINSYGTLLSAFSRDCGWIPHDRLAAMILGYETANGRDVSVPFDSPAVFDRIAGSNGRRVYRYRRLQNGEPDMTARELSRSNPYMRDALLMAVKLLNIICTTGRSIAQLNAGIPDFYVSRKRVGIDFELSGLEPQLGKTRHEFTGEGIILHFGGGRVTLTPARSGKQLAILSEAANYEISKELCGEVEKMIKKANKKSGDTNR